MSERSSVSIAEILGENYEITNIECSDYNPSIDEDITVTITVTDVYGDAISNESVTVTANEGNFTQLNGSSITAAATVTATTNISGQFTLTYTCSEWGLITFSANNKYAQIKVKGYKAITLTNGTLYVNGDTRTCELHYSKSGVNMDSANTWAFVETVSQITSYPPVDNNLFVQCNNPSIIARIYSSGSIQANTNTRQGSSIAIAFTAMWHY